MSMIQQITFHFISELFLTGITFSHWWTTPTINISSLVGLHNKMNFLFCIKHECNLECIFIYSTLGSQFSATNDEI